jgi:hypothetical protein
LLPLELKKSAVGRKKFAAQAGPQTTMPLLMLVALGQVFGATFRWVDACCCLLAMMTMSKLMLLMLLLLLLLLQ